MTSSRNLVPALGRVLISAVAALVLVLTLNPAPASAQCNPVAEEGFRMLFDGTAESLEGWTQSGPGGFQLQGDCTLKTVGGLGLLWYSAEQFDSYTLRLDWKLDKIVDNSGIFVGFPAAGENTHNEAIAKGYEVQIDQLGRSDGQSNHITGAIYDIQGPNRDTRFEGTDSRGWNTYEITVDAPKIIIELNGEVVNEFTSVDIARDISTGYFGLQNHGDPDTAYFRNVQVKEIEPGSVSGGTGGGGGGPAPVPTTGPLEELRNNNGISQSPTETGADFDGGGYAYSGAALSAGDPANGYEGINPGDTIAADGFSFTWPQVADGAPDNVQAVGQTVTLEPVAGASKIGFLGSAAAGGSGKVVFNYTYVDAAGVQRSSSTTADLAFTDWTRGLLGDAPLGPNEQVVAKSLFRATNKQQPFFFTQPNVFLVTLPIDPTKTLTSITLPNTPAIHLFDIAVS